MKSFKLAAILFSVSIALLTTVPGSTHAATFIMSFEITGFPVSLGNAAPTDPVIGSIAWEAVDIHSQIQHFDSINLTLGGHTYSLGEIYYHPDLASTPPHDLIGGTLNGDSIQNQTDDFWITWDRATLQPDDFMYASSQKPGFWHASIYQPGNFTAFSITQVPEPSSAGLLLCAVAGVLWRRRRRAGFNIRGDHGA